MTFSTLGTDTTTHQPVYLYKASRTQGTYIIGATGTGKSGLLENLITDDAKQGTGVIVIDPHGDLIKKVIARLRNKDELDRVILIDPLDTEYSPGINIYQCDNPLDDTQVEQAKERVLHIFTISVRERGDESLGVRVSQGILNSAYTFIDSSPVYGCTMLELPILFTEDIPRKNMVKQVEGKDDVVANYWKIYETFDKEAKRDRADMVVNKIQEYQMNRFMRRIIGQSKSTINFRSVIDSNPGKIVLVKLRRDHPELAKLVGSLVIAQILGAALSREREGSVRRQVHIYADEFQLYATEDFTYLLTECRKYGMAVTVAHQSRDFIDLKNKAATLQAANLITLRVIRKDADEVAGNYDTTPPPGETQTKTVLAPAVHPIDFLLGEKGGQENPVINKFVHTRLTNFLTGKPTGLHELNRILYEVMVEKNPRKIISVEILLPFAKTIFIPISFCLVSHVFPSEDENKRDWHIREFVIILNSFMSYPSSYVSTDRFGRSHAYKDELGESLSCPSMYAWYFEQLSEESQHYQYIRLEMEKSEEDFNQSRKIAQEAFSKLWVSPSREERKKLFQQISDACYHIYLTNGMLAYERIVDGMLLKDIEFEKARLLLEEAKEAAKDDKYWEEIYQSELSNCFFEDEETEVKRQEFEEEQEKTERRKKALVVLFNGVLCLGLIVLAKYALTKVSYLLFNNDIWVLTLWFWICLIVLILCIFFILCISIIDGEVKLKFIELNHVEEKLAAWEKENNKIAGKKARVKQSHLIASLSVYQSQYEAAEDRRKGFIQSHQERMDRRFTPLKEKITEEITTLETLIEELLEFMQAIADKPLQAVSELKEVPGSQVSSDEMRNRIANELATQPNRIAKVRILDKDEHIIYHTIKTRDIEQVISDKSSEKALEQRIEERLAYLRNRMIDLHYWRAKAVIDQEIAQRQAKLRQPAKPQKVEPQPLQRRIPLQPATSNSQLEQPVLSPADEHLFTLEELKKLNNLLNALGDKDFDRFYDDPLIQKHIYQLLDKGITAEQISRELDKWRKAGSPADVSPFAELIKTLLG